MRGGTVGPFEAPVLMYSVTPLLTIIKYEHCFIVLWHDPSHMFVIKIRCYFFFSEEGPRSRRYGCTAVLRLLVQPCDEDENDYFMSFSK
jgi:hypothetical protein